MLTKSSLPPDRLGVDEGGKETWSGELDEDDTEEEHHLWRNISNNTKYI